jgi:hypothetical protein
LHPYHITCLKALWPLKQIELNCFAFVQRAIPVFLNGGEMNENVLPGRALDEPVSFSPIEPLYCALLSHKKLLSNLPRDLTSASSVEHMLRITPSKKAEAQPVRGPKNPRQQEKLRRLNRDRNHGPNFWSLPGAAIFDCRTQTVNPNEYARRPRYDRRAKDNIQEVCFWQEKKLHRKTIEEECFTA